MKEIVVSNIYCILVNIYIIYKSYTKKEMQA
jgi:hypothetical protein